ncbi:hypothetical protein [Sphingobacterium sp. SGL-16]|uniref:hypothetical protein n=1 Tax=Sphingobacterium sp. SGL-16 TaxID=2710883 RepID=UPI0013EC6F9C|nr:hypothetical protein [Sphingobacterium sp. SGL-16]NGM73810.1 hypothetical protein [Sphingobacterium sp. SGL-16]
MKSLFFTFLSLMLFLMVQAQDQYAMTKDGKKVLLRSNGTWEYVNSKSTSSTPSSSNNKIQNIRSSSKNNSGRTYIHGPRGGCYYINKNGGKTYVDRSLCN